MWVLDDIVQTVERAGENLDVIIVPKVKAPRDVWFVETLLDQLEAKVGLSKRIGLEVLIEEVEALARVDEIAACSPRLEALILGVGDLSASQGVRMGHISDPALRYPGDIWHYARVRMVVAARDRREAIHGSTLGCVGKWAIHPDQVPIANEVFAPTEKEIALAKRMVDAYEVASSGGAGAGSASGVLVDAATVRIFQAVLDRQALVEQT